MSLTIKKLVELQEVKVNLMEKKKKKRKKSHFDTMPDSQNKYVAKLMKKP